MTKVPNAVEILPKI